MWKYNSSINTDDCECASLLMGQQLNTESAPKETRSQEWRKKIRLDPFACQELAESSEGAKALTNPNLVLKSSRDPNQRLYPRTTTRRSFELPSQQPKIPSALESESTSDFYDISECLSQTFSTNLKENSASFIKNYSEAFKTNQSLNNIGIQSCKPNYLLNKLPVSTSQTDHSSSEQCQKSCEQFHTNQFSELSPHSSQTVSFSNRPYHQDYAVQQPDMSYFDSIQNILLHNPQKQQPHLSKNIPATQNLTQDFSLGTHLPEGFATMPRLSHSRYNRDQQCPSQECFATQQQNLPQEHSVTRQSPLLPDVSSKQYPPQFISASQQLQLSQSISSTQQLQLSQGYSDRQFQLSQGLSASQPLHSYQGHSLSPVKYSSHHNNSKDFSPRKSNSEHLFYSQGSNDSSKINNLQISNVRSLGKKNKFIPQSNSLLNYISVSPKKKCSEINVMDFSNKNDDLCQNRCLEKKEIVNNQNRKYSCEVENNKLTHLVDKPSLLKEKVNDIYGLLGTGFTPNEEDGSEIFGKLPPEILQNILCRLPILELCLTMTRVCHYWNQLIMDDNFIPWKKNYHKLRQRVTATEVEVKQIMEENSMKKKYGFFPALIRYMGNGNLCCPKSLLLYLMKHSKYSIALILLKESAADCMIKEVPLLWSIVTGIILMSNSVKDVSEVVSLLTLPLHDLNIIHIVNKLYCIASFVWSYRMMFGLYTRIHYQLYYTLYMFENPNARCHAEDLTQLQKITKKGQQSILKYSTGELYFTPEQMRIVNHPLQPNHIVRIKALAGSGKTTTLLEFTKMRPMMRFLLVVYNKSVQIHSQKIFPANVACSTAHSLAYRAVGFKYKSKMCKSLRMFDISTHLESLEQDCAIGHHYTRAKLVLETLQNFVASAEPFITTAHVPTTVKKDEHQEIDLPWSDRMYCLKESERLWRKLEDLNDKSIRITHDMYLKFYHLSKPTFDDFDCILVDEAQDCNQAMLSIILTQSLPVVLVGDPHQQIYSFRGAVNALASIESTHTYYLTQSFRFGPEIAFIANTCLEVMKQEQNTTLVGVAPKESTYEESKKSHQLAVIVRTNVQLFIEAVRFCCSLEPKTEASRVGCVGGIASLSLDKIYNIYNLMLKSVSAPAADISVKDKFINRFENFAKLKSYALHAEDKQLLGQIRIVMMYTSKIPDYVKMLRERCVCPIEMADVILTTAHKCKGLEFDTVRISDDFHIETIPRDGTCDDEINVLYVAVTRAKKTLEQNRTIAFIMTLIKDPEENPEDNPEEENLDSDSDH